VSGSAGVMLGEVPGPAAPHGPRSPGTRRWSFERAMWRSTWRSMRRAPLLAAGALLTGALLTGACARQPVHVGADPATGSVRVQTGARLGFAPKRVVSKEPPGTLVASDGTVCRVAAERYERTKLGKAAACSWQLAYSDPER
jgi:hypothetical protein